MSKEIKILLVEDRYSNYDDDYTSTTVLRENISDWETVSDEDYDLLRQHMHMFLRQLPSGFRPIIVTKDPVRVVDRVVSIKDELAKIKAAQEAEREKRRKEEQDRAKKRMLKKAASELALLEELKKKYENNNVSDI
jgi:hypothetical protein